MRGLRRWAWNVLISIDQLGNTIAFGDPDETISSRLGRWKLAGGKHAPWYDPREMLVRVLNRIDPDHVFDAIEKDRCVPPPEDWFLPR